LIGETGFAPNMVFAVHVLKPFTSAKEFGSVAVAMFPSVFGVHVKL